MTITTNQIAKTLLFIFLFMTVSFPGFPQSKSQNKDKKPSQEELQQMMNEMQKEMENMDPEAKEMMKKMGVGMPDMNKIGYAVSGDYTDAGPIPELDAGRIQKAKQYKLNSGNLAEYIRKVHQAVNTKVGSGAAKTGIEIFQTAKSNGGGAQAANGLWAFGANLPAVVVLGNTLMEDPENTDNLNNYAAFLVMTGAEEGALPILEYLNKIYPKNSTILNNIGQAWFGLGELKIAENYLDSVIAQYAGHSQANYTKSLIQEHNGDKAGAISSMKRSLKTAYSSSKEERLKTLGYKVKGNDVSWQTHLPQDPLGFGQMNWPKYPRSIGESMSLEKEWEVYRETIREKTATVEQKLKKAEQEFTKTMEDPVKMMQDLMQTNLKLPKSAMPFASKAKAKLEYYAENDDKLELQKYETQLQNLDELEAEIRVLDNKHEKKSKEIEATLGKKIGEGATRADMEAYCAAVDKNNESYLQSVNQLLENANAKWLKYWRETMSRRLNYYQYAMPEESFELEKLRAQTTWLGLVGGQRVKFQDKCTIGAAMASPEKPVAKKLGDFYDMTCKQKSVMNLGIGSVTIECNKMTTEVEAWFVKYSSKENMDNGKIIKGTVETSFGLGDKGIKYGPVKAEIGAGGSAFIEFDNEGVTDVGVKVGASAEIDTNVLPDGMPKEAGISEQKVPVLGAEARWGWNSGGSVEGKGLLSGISIK